MNKPQNKKAALQGTQEKSLLASAQSAPTKEPKRFASVIVPYVAEESEKEELEGFDECYRLWYNKIKGELTWHLPQSQKNFLHAIELGDRAIIGEDENIQYDKDDVIDILETLYTSEFIGDDDDYERYYKEIEAEDYFINLDNIFYYQTTDFRWDDKVKIRYEGDKDFSDTMNLKEFVALLKSGKETTTKPKQSKEKGASRTKNKQ